MLRLLATLLFLALAAPSPSMAAPTVLKAQGSAEFKGSAKGPLGVGTINFTGTGSKVTGELQLEGGNVAGTLWLDMTAWKTGMDMRDDHLAEVFEVNKYPKAKLTLTPSLLKTEGAMPVAGVLTLKDSSAPADGSCEVRLADKAGEYVAVCKLSVSLDRFQSVGKIERATAVVNPDVAVEVHLKAAP